MVNAGRRVQRSTLLHVLPNIGGNPAQDAIEPFDLLSVFKSHQSGQSGQGQPKVERPKKPDAIVSELNLMVDYEDKDDDVAYGPLAEVAP